MNLAGRMKWRKRAVLLTALGLAALATSAAAVEELTFTPGDTLTIPGEGRLTGLTMAGMDTVALLNEVPDSLSTTGARTIRLVVQGVDGEIYHEADFSGVLDRALAWDGEYLWACGDADDGSSIIYKIAPDSLGVLTIEDAVTAPGHRPASLAFDGRYLWLTDRDSGRIDRFDPKVKEFTRSVVAPGFSPFGLAWDGAAMWLTDSGTGRIYRLAGSRLRWSGTVAPDIFLARGSDVRLFHDGEKLRFLPPGGRLAVGVDFE
jgi:hypothetical protein